MKNLAALFGMTANDLATIITTLAAGIATVIGAVGKILKDLHGARKRSFQKIRRIENILEKLAYATKDAELAELIQEMKADQRDESDEKDAN